MVRPAQLLNDLNASPIFSVRHVNLTCTTCTVWNHLKINDTSCIHFDTDCKLTYILIQAVYILIQTVNSLYQNVGVQLLVKSILDLRFFFLSVVAQCDVTCTGTLQEGK